LPDLELEEEIKQIFKRMIGKETNKQIEEFIKEKIFITEYSYHQVQTFIKLFISLFSITNIKFINSQKDDITIKYFAEYTKYFTNGGFQKLIMNKKQQIKDKIDLCLGAYENDLNNVKFKTPLIFIDKETEKCKFEILPDISKENEEENQDINFSKEVDIVYLIDATAQWKM